MGQGDDLDLQTLTPLPRRLAIGGGSALFIDGSGGADLRLSGRLELGVGGRFEPLLGAGLPLPGVRHGASYWWTIASFERDLAPGQVELAIRERRSGRTVRLGEIELVVDAEPPDPVAPVPEPGAGAAAPVAICMACFEPDPELFGIQIESIRAQTHRNWVCLISDDGSSPEGRAAIAAALGDDRRFALSVGSENLGFYANFERALQLGRASGARYLALADQDDRWEPHKLEALLGGLAPGSRLVYSDMRLVSRGGVEIAPTYWTMRRNNYTDFGSLILANTVTGAASLFEASLLDDALPFPPRHGALFHDHWIASVALALGPISYVDEPLSDYVQHDEAALGHLRANAFGRYSGSPRQRLVAGWGRLRGRRFRLGWRSPYFNVFIRIMLTRRILLNRLGDRLTSERRQVLESIGDNRTGIVWLARRSGRDLRGANETLGRERAILAGLAWRRGALLRARLRRR